MADALTLQDLMKHLSILKEDLLEHNVQQLKSELSTLKADLKEHTVQIIDDRMQHFSEFLQSTHEEIEDLKNENSSIKKLLSSSLEENELLKAQIQKVSLQTNSNFRYSLRKNVLLHGVPEKENEKPLEIVKDTLKNWNLDFSNDLEGVAHRLGKPRDDQRHIRPIVCSFLRRTSVQAFVAESLNRKKKGQTDVYTTFHLSREEIQARKDRRGLPESVSESTNPEPVTYSMAAKVKESFPLSKSPGSSGKTMQRPLSQRQKMVPNRLTH